MGSLCCVAARPHVSSTGSREWSLGRSDPFWRTNSSFSPPLSRRWNNRFHSDGLSYGSYDDGAGMFYGSSISSNSKGSRSWVISEQFLDHHYPASDGAISYISSHSDSFQNEELTPPVVQGVNFDEYVREPATETQTFLRFVERTPSAPHSVGSVSSRSDGSEYETTSKSHNFPCPRGFMSKPVHPLCTSEMDFGGGITPGSETAQWSSSGSEPEPIEPESVDSYEGSKCGLCERFLSRISPWGSRRIFHGGDMPISSVLPCCHVYHAECLERATPKSRQHDPPCPLCDRSAKDWVRSPQRSSRSSRIRRHLSMKGTRRTGI